MRIIVIQPEYYLATIGPGKTGEDTENLPGRFPKTGGITMKLTKQSIATVKKNAGKKSDYIEWDDELKGFGLRLRDGKYTWIFQYKFNGANFRMRLGTFPPLSPDDARPKERRLQSAGRRSSSPRRQARTATAGNRESKAEA